MGSTEPEIVTRTFGDDGAMPNNPALPVILYRRAVDPSGADPASAFEALFARNGWGGSWRNGVFPYHHFHSNAHEVLGIARGRVRVRLGGDSGETFDLEAGDVALLPAGTGHKNEGASADLLVVGAYPSGSRPDLCRESPGDARVRGTIRNVPLPPTDPVGGTDGPVSRHWRAAATS